jgi:hypothetical protein
MFRRILQLLSVLSLLLAFAMSVLWIRSYWYLDEFRWIFERPLLQNHYMIRDVKFTSGTGGMLISVQRLDIDLTRMVTLHHIMEPNFVQPGHHYTFETSRFPLPWYDAVNYGNMLADGFSFKHESGKFFASPHLGQWTWIHLPLWSFILLFSLPGILHTTHRFKRRLRRRRSLCPTCGYDLRESKSTCPECGASVSP